jgi:hypothetical protein
MMWSNVFVCLLVAYGPGFSAVVQKREPITVSKKVNAEEPQVSLALIEVNNERAKRGLRPFIEDKLLTQAARKAAGIRAANLIEGHINDFACLPPGARADAAGCAAWPASMGWGSCCTYDNYLYAGAAWDTGSDGQRYMHLFVRN